MWVAFLFIICYNIYMENIPDVYITQYNYHYDGDNNDENEEEQEAD